MRRCPNCGHGDIFRSWGTLLDRCPGCTIQYEREEGYWLGAIVINTAVTIGLFMVTMVVWAALAWPDPPWGTMTAVGAIINLVVPLVFYPLSKTLWLAVEIGSRSREATVGSAGS